MKCDCDLSAANRKRSGRLLAWSLCPGLLSLRALRLYVRSSLPAELEQEQDQEFTPRRKDAKVVWLVVSQFESWDWETDLWLMVTPTMRRADSIQPHLRATPAQAILKNVGGRFAAWQNLSTD